MARIAIFDGHPSSDRDHYVHALANAYGSGAEDPHEVRQIGVADLNFSILRDPNTWIKAKPEADIEAAQQTIDWADHAVIIFPLWLGDMPALLKAFFEQISRPGFAIEMKEGGTWRKLLGGKSTRIIVTMGMPSPIYRFLFRAHSVKSLKRNILHFVGFKPVRTTIIGHVDRSNSHRKRWLERVERLGRFAR